MQIRMLQKSDNDIYTKLWQQALIQQNSFFRISIEDYPAPKIQTKFSGENFTFGAFVDGNLVGTLSVARDIQTKLKHKALLFRMFVHPDHAGKGIGKALVKQAIIQSKSIQGLRQLYLTVLANNETAIHLYQSCGFDTFAHEPESVEINSQFVDELQMVLLLKKYYSIE